MKSEFALAFNEIAERSKLGREVIVEALETALVSAYRRSVNASAAQLVTATIDPATGAVSVFAEKEVVEEVQDERTEVALEEARKVDPNAQLNDLVSVDSTPDGFGRIAAQTAKQVILQRIREAERESQYQEYVDREGDIVHGTVQNVTPANVTVGLGRAEALMPRNQQMAGERFHAHDKVRAYVLEVRRSPRGPQIIVSRTHKNMLRRLLEMEVPEIYNGSVEIKSIAREPGHRSKVAVAALQPGVDPVGACVGMRGVRIQSIVRELNDEKIDVIEWNPDQDGFIAKALSPARVTGVFLDDFADDGRTATVVVPDDQLSLAIGREGQNARLAAKLTGWRIDIKSLTEASQECMQAFEEDPELADIVEELAEQIQQAKMTLAKKAEGKPIMPEEFAVLTALVIRYERFRMERNAAARAAQEALLAEVRKDIPPTAYETPLPDVDAITPRLLETLLEAKFETAGQLLETLIAFPDRVLALAGIGPKVMENLATWLREHEYPQPVVEEPEPELEPEAAAVSEEAETTTEETVVAEEAAEDAVETAAELEPVAPEPVEGPIEPVAEDVPFDEAIIQEEIIDRDEVEKLELVTTKKKKKKKKKKRTITYDEEVGAFIATRHRKPSRLRGAWDELEE